MNTSPHGYVGYEDGKGRPRTCEEAEAELRTAATARAEGVEAGAANERTIIALWCESQAAWCMARQPPRREEASVYRRVAAQIRTLP